MTSQFCWNIFIGTGTISPKSRGPLVFAETFEKSLVTSWFCSCRRQSVNRSWRLQSVWNSNWSVTTSWLRLLLDGSEQKAVYFGRHLITELVTNPLLRFPQINRALLYSYLHSGSCWLVFCCFFCLFFSEPTWVLARSVCVKVLMWLVIEKVDFLVWDLN